MELKKKLIGFTSLTQSLNCMVTVFRKKEAPSDTNFFDLLTYTLLLCFLYKYWFLAAMQSGFHWSVVLNVRNFVEKEPFFSEYEVWNFTTDVTYKLNSPQKVQICLKPTDCGGIWISEVRSIYYLTKADLPFFY